MADQLRKAVLYEEFARVGKALANPVRLELLDLLAQGERSVQDLAEAAAMRVNNTSAQLKVLAATGLVTTRRSGTRVYYRLADAQVVAFLEAMKDLAHGQLADVERATRAYLGDLDGLELIDRGELVRRLQTGEAVVLDVRPAPEYEAGHIPGAVCIPYDRLVARLDELSHDVELIAYCRGRYCAFAPDAVRLLRQRGYPARLLEGGMSGWHCAGLPVAAA